MSRKTFLHATGCLLFFSFSLNIALSQQQQAVRGSLLMSDQRPRIASRDGSNIDLSRRSPYRSYDGRNNNITSSANALFGAADIPLYRELASAYASGDTKNAMGGVSRPSARQISNAVIDEPVTQINTRHLSTLVYQWGQFLDHEITLTPTGSTEYAFITLPKDEKVFTEEIPFFRSEFRMVSAGTGGTVRQQINLNTSFIDGSVVYGSDETRARWLRTMKNGKLKTSSGNLMPYNTIDGELSSAIDPKAPGMANDSSGKVKTFVAGDVRAAENPVLASIHTVFVREHNRICDRLVSQGLRNDEQLYQMARKEVGALIAAITYQEFLPALGIILQSYSGYKSFVRPDIMNTFATASYRIGHTMVSDDVVFVDNDCEEVSPGEMDLVEVFWNPQLVAAYGVDIFIKGASSHDQYETDTKINDVLRNFLFGSPNDPVRFGIDLGSLNIQRGRDHGLPDYNTARRFYTGTAASSFSDISPVDSTARALRKLYGDVNNVDLWIGILAEKHLPNKSVGLTMNAMLKSQFEKLRDGDFYFYLNDPYLSASVRNSVRNTKFSDIIKRNTNLTNILTNVFITDSCHNDEEANRLITTIPQQNLPVIEENSQFRAYPNPATNVLNIDLKNAEAVTVKIYSATGNLVRGYATGKIQKNIQLNVSGLTSGTYVVSIISDKEIKSFRFVKL